MKNNASGFKTQQKLVHQLLLVLSLLLLGSVNPGWGQSQTFTTTGAGQSFTVPAGVTTVTVQAWGAGGGGSTITTNTPTRGGGGGGGAYANRALSVTPGNTYNIVVGAGGAANTTGGNSSFNSTALVAAGGRGATSNSATAGAGGTTANSTGTTEYAGGNGANGGATYSGGGGGGAGSNGSGGNATGSTAGTGTSLSGGNGGAGVNGGTNGNKGNIYGGGGSGAVTNSSTNRTGGSGANGMVIVSWSCLSYNIDATSASSNLVPGSTSLVTLFSSTLTSGTYTVTYDLGAPNASLNNTAVMTFTSGNPGTGTFNTRVLANSGTTLITVTDLTSGAGTGSGTSNCSSVISSNNTTNVYIGASRYSVATGTGNWNSTSTWAATSGGSAGASVPVAGDVVYIEGGHNVMVDADATCGSITFLATSATSLTINQGITLNVSNAITIPRSGIGYNQIIVGDGNLNAGSVAFTSISNNNGHQITISSGTVTVEGNVSSTAGTVSATIEFLNAGTLNLGGTFFTSTTGKLTTSAGCTVNYNGAAQTVGNFSYYNLTLSGSGIKTVTGVTINGTLSLEETASVTGTPVYGGAATLQYNKPASFTSGAEWITPFVATGGVIIANTGLITANAAKVINSNSPLTLQNGSSLAMSTFLLTLNDDLINNGATTSGSGGVVITGTSTQSIGSFTNTGTVSMYKTGGTATFTGAVNGGALTINGSGGTLNLGTGLTHTFSGSWTRTNGTLNGGSSTLRLGSGYSGSGGTFTANTGTVEWNAAGAQTIAAVVYNNLTLSGSGAKTTTGATVNGILSMEGSATSLGTVVTYGSSATLQYEGSVAQTTGIEFPGTFSSSGGVIINNINGVTIAGNKTISGILSLTSGILTTSSANLLSVSNTASSAISGGSSTSFINGPVIWTLPGNLSLSSTYYFPIGSGTTYLPFTLVNPTTGSGVVPALAQAFIVPTGGTFNSTLSSISTTEYWSLTTSGNFLNTSVSLTRQSAITPFDAIAGSSTLTGVYILLAGTAGTFSVTESNAIGANHFFVMAGIKQTITTGAITGSPFNSGAPVLIPFTIAGTFASGNVFTAQLSDASGNFESPVTIGSQASTIAETISGTIQGMISSGTGYRIRVVSSTPSITGTDNGTNLTIILSGTWLGTTSSDWHTASNWSYGVPITSTDIIIPSGGNQPLVSSTAVCNNLTINSGAVLTLIPGATLTVTGTIINSAGTSGLVLESDAAGTASLIHNSTNVPATVYRYISGNAEAWHFLSSPVAAQILSGAWLPSGTYGNGTGYDLYIWDEETSCWIYKLDSITIRNWNIVHPGNNFEVGRGYLYSVQSANPTKQFTGNLNNGNQSIPVTSTGTDVSLIGFNLIGNPYPSSVDWQAASGWTRTSLFSSAGGYDMWIWNPAAENYGVVNSASGSGTNGVTRYIAPMQGFFVRAERAGTLSLTNSVRVHQLAGNWLKKSAIIDPKLIVVTSRSIGGEGSDEIQLLFGSEQNEPGAKKLFSPVVSAPSLFLSLKGENYSVLHLSDTVDNPIVPIYFKPGRDGSYSISFTFDYSQFENVVIEDRKTNYFQDLKTSNIYTYKASKADDQSRFILHFTRIENYIKTELPAAIYTADNQLIIDLSKINEETEIIVCDIMGSILLKNKLQGETRHSLSVNSGSQVLIVRLKNQKGIKSKKVAWINT